MDKKDKKILAHVTIGEGYPLKPGMYKCEKTSRSFDPNTKTWIINPQTEIVYLYVR